MADILDWFKDSENVSEQFLVHRGLRPLGPVFDIFGIGAAGNRRGNLRMCDTKLDGQLRNIDTSL